MHGKPPPNAFKDRLIKGQLEQKLRQFGQTETDPGREGIALTECKPNDVMRHIIS
jgi:hypothetical protein